MHRICYPVTQAMINYFNGVGKCNFNLLQMLESFIELFKVGVQSFTFIAICFGLL